MQQLPSGGWLLGDSGYPLRPWLMTPILTPLSKQEEMFNRSHVKTRNCVERAFGVLKSRFRQVFIVNWFDYKYINKKNDNNKMWHYCHAYNERWNRERERERVLTLCDCLVLLLLYKDNSPYICTTLWIELKSCKKIFIQ